MSGSLGVLVLGVLVLVLVFWCFGVFFCCGSFVWAFVFDILMCKNLSTSFGCFDLLYFSNYRFPHHIVVFRTTLL